MTVCHPSLPYSVTRFSPDAASRPDLRSRASMLEYLIKHDRHDESNGFGSLSFVFSNCVKLRSLHIQPPEYRDKAAAVLDYQFDTGDWSIYESLFEDFKTKQAVAVGFTGRSSGHLALFDPNNRASLSPSELRELSLPELRELARLVLAFDALCDSCLTAFMDAAIRYEVMREEVTYTRIQPVLVPRPANSEVQE